MLDEHCDIAKHRDPTRSSPVPLAGHKFRGGTKNDRLAFGHIGLFEASGP